MLSQEEGCLIPDTRFLKTLSKLFPLKVDGFGVVVVI